MTAKIFSLIMAFFILFFSASSPMPGTKGMDVEPDKDFSPVLRFVVSSDSHIKKYGDDKCRKLAKMINTGYAAAEKDKAHPTLDAAVLVGDTTNFGLPTSFAAVKATVDGVLKPETDFLAIAAKNHDSYLGRISRCYISGITGDKADFHKVINGFHFIGLSASPKLSAHYSDKQIKWLKTQLDEAVADAPGKPVFVFQHEHIKETVYGSLSSDGWGVDYLTDTLSQYPTVIDFSGHSHYPANDPRAIWQDTFTAINDGGLAYYEFTIDGSTSQHPESSDNMAHMLLVEADADNNVRVKVCDLTAEKVLTEWVIDNVAEAKKTKYAHTARKAAASAPAFDGELSAKVDGSGFTVSSAPAKAGEGDEVFIYRLTITGENGTALSFKKLSDYYKTDSPADISFTGTIDGKGKYTASLIAEDVWGYASEPITAEFTVN